MNNQGNESTLAGGVRSNTPTGDSRNTPTSQSRPGGAPVRTYLNDKIVPYLLDGMKSVAKEQPSNPLRMLGEFLIQKSDEIEGGAACKKEPPE